MKKIVIALLFSQSFIITSQTDPGNGFINNNGTDSDPCIIPSKLGI